MTLSLAEKNDRWRCRARSCNSDVGLRRETWLEGTTLPLDTIVYFAAIIRDIAHLYPLS